MSWIPTDADLDTVAKTLPADEPPRSDDARAKLLAIAVTRKQVSRRSPAPLVAAGFALAAAAVAIVWLVARPAPQVAAKQTITPIGVAQFERVSDWPDFVVRLDRGKIDVQ